MIAMPSSAIESHRQIDPLTLQQELARIFPDYTVSYAVMTDTFRLRNKHFRHSLHYNTHKTSRLESRSEATRRFTMYFNLGLLAMVVLVTLMDGWLGWGLISRPLFSSDMYYFGLILLLGLLQYLIPVVKPGLKRDMEAEHLKVRRTLEVLLM